MIESCLLHLRLYRLASQYFLATLPCNLHHSPLKYWQRGFSGLIIIPTGRVLASGSYSHHHHPALLVATCWRLSQFVFILSHSLMHDSLKGDSVAVIGWMIYLQINSHFVFFNIQLKGSIPWPCTPFSASQDSKSVRCFICYPLEEEGKLSVYQEPLLTWPWHVRMHPILHLPTNSNRRVILRGVVPEYALKS